MLAEDYLYSLYDFEKEKSERRKKKAFTLERVHTILDALELKDLNYSKVIHIAGTKGKGSTLQYLKHCFLKKKQNVGLFTSPHLISVHERIQINFESIPDGKMLDYAKRVYEKSCELLDEKLSFFETLFLIALLHFKSEGVDYILLETGLGGRLDATNCCAPDLVLLSKIDYDHCEILGDTLDKIAGEKAGIIKEKIPVLAIQQEGVVNDVFMKKASEKNAPITFIESNTELLPLGKAENIKLALRAYQNFYQNESCVELRKDLEDLTLYGRYQLIERDLDSLFLDSCHNEISIRQCVDYLKTLNREMEVCFAMTESREPKDLLKPLVELNAEYIFAPIPADRPGVSPKLLSEVMGDLTDKNVNYVENIKELKDWLSKPSEKLKVIIGSFYLVGEVLKGLTK